MSSKHMPLCWTIVNGMRGFVATRGSRFLRAYVLIAQFFVKLLKKGKLHFMLQITFFAFKNAFPSG